MALRGFFGPPRRRARRPSPASGPSGGLDDDEVDDDVPLAGAGPSGRAVVVTVEVVEPSAVDDEALLLLLDDEDDEDDEEDAEDDSDSDDVAGALVPAGGDGSAGAEALARALQSASRAVIPAPIHLRRGASGLQRGARRGEVDTRPLCPGGGDGDKGQVVESASLMPRLGSFVGLALALLAIPVACARASAGDEAPAAVTIAGPPPFAVKARSEWPTAAWPTATPAEVGLDPAALDRLEAYAFARSGDDHDRKGTRTNALVIVKDGKLVFERYARGYGPETPLLTWSVSKSVAGTLVGRALMEGRLDVNDSVARHYPPADRDGVRDVRLVDLLRMSSGLDWNETYETSPIFSSVMAMLYTRGRADMPAFVASHDLAHRPGSHWSYSSGDTMLLMGALRGAVGEEAWPEYPWTALFDRIGMKSAVWETDGAGTFVGSSYLYASARDLAKWAFLYLNDGVWAGERLLPEGWVAFTLTMAPAYYDTELTPGTIDDNPGAQVYLNHGDPRRGVPKPWPMAPDDLFGAQGHWGKAIYAIPSLDLIVVRMGDDRHYACAPGGAAPGCEPDVDKAYSKTHFIELVMATVQR